MSEHPFDDLARTLATGASRRGVLKAIGGAVLGSLVAAPPQPVLADNSACAHFCASVFGADTRAAGQCTSDAAHGKGLCHTCGGSTPARRFVAPETAAAFAPATARRCHVRALRVKPVAMGSV
jgi:hypothetical protein